MSDGKIDAIEIMRKCQSMDDMIEAMSYHADLLCGMMIVFNDFTKGGNDKLLEGIDAFREMVVDCSQRSTRRSTPQLSSEAINAINAGDYRQSGRNTPSIRNISRNHKHGINLCLRD